MQESNWPLINCNLCGSNGALIKCEKCEFYFCLSCDDMYHKHPKRRFHLRKPIVERVNKKLVSFETYSTKATLPPTDRTDRRPPQVFSSKLFSDSGHPSKMPIPPPRRKRKGLTLSGIKDTFTNTGNIFRRFVNHDKFSPQPKDSYPQITVPLIEKPLKTIPNTYVSKENQFSSANASKSAPSTPKYERDISQAPPPLPQKPASMIYENYRKLSLPMIGKSSSLQRTSNSFDEISSETERVLPNGGQQMAYKVESKLKSSSLNRRNYSLHDLSDVSESQFNQLQAYPSVCAHHYPYCQYYGSPWTSRSLNHSLEEIQCENNDSDNDSDNSETNISKRTNSRSRYKKANIKRSQSAFQMLPLSPVPPVPPLPPPSPFCYYYYPPPYCPPSPTPAFHFKSNNRRTSIDRVSSGSSSQVENTTQKFNKSRAPKIQKYSKRGKDLSDSGEKSSSSRHQSEYDDEDFFSASYEKTTDEEISDKLEENALNGEWSCRFCTYINDSTKHVCEMCSKTHVNKSNLIVKNNERNNNNNNYNYNNNNGCVDKKSKLKSKKETPKESKVLDTNCNSANDVIFDDNLILEQKNIEKELFRRLEIEKKVREENEKIANRDEILKKKENDLVEQLRNENNTAFDSKLITNTIDSGVQSLDQIFRDEFELKENKDKIDVGISTDRMSPLHQNGSLNILTQTTSTSTQYLAPVEDKPNSTKIQANSTQTIETQIPTQRYGQQLNEDQYQHFGHNAMMNAQQLYELTRNEEYNLKSQLHFNNEQNIFNPSQPFRPYIQRPRNIQNQLVSHLTSPQYAQNVYNYDSRYGSLSSLDQFPMQTSMANSRYTSNDDLQPINNNQQQLQLESGLHLIQLLRNAEKSGFTADDVEVAINFNPTKPLEWLEENWANMVETVMTLANNQIIQSETKKGTKKMLHLYLITDKDAKSALRTAKGNIWQSIEKCVKAKRDSLCGEVKSSFSMNISGLGSGKDNDEANYFDASDMMANSDDKNDIELENDGKDIIEESMNIRYINSKFYINKNINDGEVNDVIDDKSIEGLLANWKKEKETNKENKRLQKQLDEKQKLIKIIDQQNKTFYIDSEESDEELNLEVEETLANNINGDQNWTNVEYESDEESISDKQSYKSASIQLNVSDNTSLASIRNKSDSIISVDISDDRDLLMESEEEYDEGVEFEQINNEIKQLIISEEDITHQIEPEININTIYVSEELKCVNEIKNNDNKIIEIKLAKSEIEFERQESIENYANITENIDKDSFEEKEKLIENNQINDKNPEVITEQQINDQKNNENNKEQHMEESDSNEVKDNYEFNLINEECMEHQNKQNTSNIINLKTEFHISSNSEVKNNTDMLNVNLIDNNIHSTEKTNNDFGKPNYELNNENLLESEFNNSELDLLRNKNKAELFKQINETLEKNSDKIQLLEINKIHNIEIKNKYSQPSLQLPVFGKEKGSDKVRKALLHKTEEKHCSVNARDDETIHSQLFASNVDVESTNLIKLNEYSPKENARHFIMDSINQKIENEFSVNNSSINSIKEIEKNIDSIKGNDFYELSDNKIIYDEYYNNGNKFALPSATLNEQGFGKNKCINHIKIEEYSDHNKNQNKSESDRDCDKEVDATLRKNLSHYSDTLLDNQRISNNSSSKLKKEGINASIANVAGISSVAYDPNFGWARTHYECELCADIYAISDIVAMISCTHFACRNCLRQYFTIQIREKQKLIIICPFCDEPVIDQDDDDAICDYLSLLDQLIRHLVDSDVYELFQRKVRDRALMRDPNFRWCTQCSSGFIAPNPQSKTVMCPDCKSLTCAQCRKTWKKQHFNITCEQFAEWEQAMDPEYAKQELDRHLKEFGIDCPNCKFQYQLAKGGCMHFRCLQCSYDFCGGCQLPFKIGNRCGLSEYCVKLGLHAHHPRNCLFYLRDKEAQDLQRLLDQNNIEYKTALDSNMKATRCSVMEQRETESGFKDLQCGRYIESAGLCRLHYKEYLGNLIWKHNIDPISIFNEDELEVVLKRANVKLAPKVDGNEYRLKLIEAIQQNLPLLQHTVTTKY